METKIFSFLILLLLTVSCVKQDHNNPFDSQCPKELWTPTDFKATLEGTTVKLTWNQSENRISGFKLTKKVDSGSDLALPSQTKDASQFIDVSLTVGKLHVYTLVAYAGNNQSNIVTVQITPTFLATIATSSATSITANSVVIGGNITIDGGSSITERGVFWGTTANPVTSGNKVPMGSGSGTFSGNITGLLPATLYYFCAYAINSLGTASGSNVIATTSTALPTITTTPISEVTATTAKSGGNVLSDGGAAITARGICWSPSENPITTNSKTMDGNGTGVFTSSITGLLPGKVYYFRAYATNSVGTVYGDQQTAPTPATVPTVTTVSISITFNSITIGGNISTDGGSPVMERGVYWGTKANPVTTGNKVPMGSGTGAFSGTINGLSPTTTYYFRAYAINSVGSAYGSEVTSTTVATLPTISTTTTSAITSSTATSGGNITNDGGSAVTARGVCWAKTTNPTIDNSKTNEGIGTEPFTSNISGLTRGTIYYIRAYATNGIGTSYGGQETFTTLAEAPALITTVVSSITNTTAKSGGSFTSDGGSEITAKGVCWATTTNPTIADNKTTDGSGTANYTSVITGLTSETTYYLRSYATNSVATSYGSEVSFTPGIVTDIDGNVYHTVTICDQAWLVENLKTTKYRNGDPIDNVLGDANWASLIYTGAYCWYNNDVAYKSTYGALYNYWAVSDSRKIAPLGCHVPSIDEWNTLINCLGGASESWWGKLKETGTAHWLTPNTDANNSSGFFALPGGDREAIEGKFEMMGLEGFWWSSTQDNAPGAKLLVLYYNYLNGYTSGYYFRGGFSVRCLRD